MIPPPMTVILLGTSFKAIAPVLVITLFSSMVNPGKGVASLPVAMKMFLARTCVFASFAQSYLDGVFVCKGAGSFDVFDVVLLEEKFDTLC